MIMAFESIHLRSQRRASKTTSLLHAVFIRWFTSYIKDNAFRAYCFRLRLSSNPSTRKASITN